MKKIQKRLNLPLGGRILLWIYWFFYSRFRYEESDDLEDIRQQLDTALKVQAWLFYNIEYVKDTGNHWQSAEETFERRKGDCEDWAILANYCLRDREAGYILCMYTEDHGHATYLIFDRGRFFRSLGTFGLQNHAVDFGNYGLDNIGDFLGDWRGYDDWEKYKLYDEDLKKIKTVKRNVSDKDES